MTMVESLAAWTMSTFPSTRSPTSCLRSDLNRLVSSLAPMLVSRITMYASSSDWRMTESPTTATMPSKRSRAGSAAADAASNSREMIALVTMALFLAFRG